MVKILKSLETVIDKTKSARACNMIAEFNQIQDKKEGTAIEAARYYSISSEQGCQIGIHWMGVFYHLGFGVAKNLDKAIELLTRACKQGNGQSMYQLGCVYTFEEAPHRDLKKAYLIIEKAVLRGVSFFDEFHALFRDNYDELSPLFLASKKPTTLIDTTIKADVLNLHAAYLGEMKLTFSQAMGKDRLYNRPVGFMQDQ